MIMRKIFILSMSLFMLLCSCRNQSETSINMPVTDQFYQLSPGAVTIEGFLGDNPEKVLELEKQWQCILDDIREVATLNYSIDS